MLGIAGSLIGDVWSRNPEDLHMELTLLSAIENTDVASPTYAVVGAREIDMSVLPESTRRVYLVATLQSAALAAVTYLELWDVTNGVLVTGAMLNNSTAPNPLMAETFVSAQLTEGSSAGNIRTDTPSEYELRLYRSGGVATDLVGVLSAYIRVVFE